MSGAQLATPTPDTKKVIGDNLRALRLARNLTQGALAAQLPRTVTRARISDWEHGLYRPSDRYVELLAKALGVDVSRFYQLPDKGGAQ